MKTRIVLWGTNASEERVLLALSLDADKKSADIWVFPEEIATESLYNRLLNEWRMGREVPFPEVFVQFERPVTPSEPLLPEDVKADSPDIIERAHTEWQFVILSARLFNMYRDELEFLRNKVEDLNKFDNALWEELKGYWEKVQAQIQEKNLFREHARELRELTNGLFGKMKDLRRKLDDEFRHQSKDNVGHFMDVLDDIQQRVESGLGLQPLFEELKEVQRKYRKTDFTRDDRNRVWNRLDTLFKEVKEKRFGKGYDTGSSALDRVQRRYEGLINAINKMEKSIARDRRDLKFEEKRIEESEGQLEAQIREAKRVMIEGRVESKESKLQEMLRTREELEKKIAKEKEKLAEQKVQEEVEQKKEEIKEKIAEEIKEANAAMEEKAEELEHAAQVINEKEPAGEKRTEQGDSLAGAAAATIGDALLDASDTVRAVAGVVGDHIEQAIHDMMAGSEEE